MRSVQKAVIAVVLAVVAGAGLAFAFSNPFSGAEKAKAVNGTVTIPLAKVSDGSAHKFRFEDGGKPLTFFLVKGTDGNLHAAFDACDVCFQEKKGYEQKGNAMLCRNCGKKFAINMIGSANNGGCNPSHLDFTVQGNSVLIKTASIQAGAKFF
jgi:uncharacterized membrane protein